MIQWQQSDPYWSLLLINDDMRKQELYLIIYCVTAFTGRYAVNNLILLNNRYLYLWARENLVEENSITIR